MLEFSKKEILSPNNEVRQGRYSSKRILSLHRVEISGVITDHDATFLMRKCMALQVLLSIKLLGSLLRPEINKKL